MKILKNNIAVIEGDSHISKWVEKSGRLDHDQNMLPLVLRYINAGDVVIDAGAFIGDHTIAYAGKVGALGMVHAFEPNPESFEALTHNLHAWKNVALSDKALSKSATKFQLNNLDKNKGAAFLSEGEGIDAISIDSVFYPGRVNFIKLDCEGMELEILQGGLETLKVWHPKMLIEINRGALKRRGASTDDIFNFLAGLSYTYRNIYPGQGLEGEQLDLLCE